MTTGRDNGSFSNISLTECQEGTEKAIWKKGNLENKRVVLTLSGADVHTQSNGIDPQPYRGLYRGGGFQDISFKNET